jgi:hypothetical protein
MKTLELQGARAHGRRHFVANLRIHSTALLALLALAACEDPIQPGPLSNNTNSLGHSNGLVEVTISGIGSDQMSSVARYIPGTDASSQSSAATSGISRVSPMTGRLSTTNVPNGVEISALSTSSFTHGERGNGGYRYVSATYKVRNAPAAGGTGYSHTQLNVTFVGVNGACSGGSTLDGTAICSLKTFAGGAADAGLALQVLPTGGAQINPATGSLSASLADVLQVYEEGDISDVPLPSGGVSILPYGFVVRTSSNSNRNLPASPSVGQYAGLVTFAFRVPLQATKEDDPFTISALFLPVEDGTLAVTQSLEETDAASVSAINSRASALSAYVLSMTGQQFSVTTNGICSVRTAGDAGTPTAYLVNGLNNVVSPAPYTAGASFVAANSVFTLSACRLLHAATAGNFVVHGSLSGWLHDTYASGDATTISTPARTGGYFPGEELQVSLTPYIFDALDNPFPTPRVLGYRVATTSGNGTVGSPTNYSTGPDGMGITLGDVNGDGKLDLAVSYVSDSVVTIRLGNGDGSFGSATDFLTGGDGTVDVRLVDIDHDGDLDIVTATRDANFSQSLSVLLGDGAGNFGAYARYATGFLFGTAHMAVADFNADGNLDVALNAASGSAIMLNDGGGSFSFYSSFSSTAGPIAVGDVDNDGDLDLVQPRSSFSIRIGVNNGTGAFGTVDVPVSNAQMWISLADVNNDGNLDILYGSNNGLGVVLGDGQGGFAEAGSSPFATGGAAGRAAQLAVGDMNHDGNLDVVVTDAGTPASSVTVMLGDGNGGFTPSASAVPVNGDTSGGVVIGDLNGNGSLDVVTLNVESDNVSVQLGNP